MFSPSIALKTEKALSMFHKINQGTEFAAE
jgi:hypothetical protein